MGERESDLKSAHSVEHVKEKGEGSSSEIRIEKCEQSQNSIESNKKTRIAYVDQLYTSKYKKFFYYCWIKKFVASRVVMRTNSTSSRKFQGVGASHNLKYIPTTCTSIEDIVLEWEDFQHFYDIISSSNVLKDNDFLNYPELRHFFQS